MNTKLALTAIAMFAVIMGLSAFAPTAMGTERQNGNQVTICHFESDPAGDSSLPGVWEIITVNEHSVQKHIDNHGDHRIADNPNCPAVSD